MNNYDLKFPSLRIASNPHQREANCAQVRGAPFLVVGPQSPLSWLRAVEQIALYFKRELNFDYAPYSIEERFKPELRRDRALVFYKTETLEHRPTPRNPKDFTNAYTFFGAIGVRWRESEDAPASWSVAWVWLHPYERRRGHLREAWSFLLKMFPNPRVEEANTAMSAFLKKVGYIEQQNQESAENLPA